MRSMTGSPTLLCVATFNVCGLPWSQSSLPSLSERAVEFGRRIEESGLDVVNLQEVWGRRALAVIRARLPSFPHLAWRRGVAGQPAGGLVTFSRRPVGAVSYTSFHGALPDAGGVRFRARRAVNSLLQGVLTVELVGLGTVVANTHLTANKDGDWSAGNRYHAFQRRQVGMVHAALRRARRADTELMVVTGDFNIASGASLYPLIVDGGAWRDPFATIDPVTFHPEFLPAGCTGNRIDYALVLGDEARFPVVDSGLLFAEPVVLADGGRMYLSDHVALTVRLGLGCVPTERGVS
jgi:Endonuclease/Exonuclease/phosphatase family